MPPNDTNANSRYSMYDSVTENTDPTKKQIAHTKRPENLVGRKRRKTLATRAPQQRRPYATLTTEGATTQCEEGVFFSPWNKDLPRR